MPRGAPLRVLTEEVLAVCRRGIVRHGVHRLEHVRIIESRSRNRCYAGGGGLIGNLLALLLELLLELLLHMMLLLLLLLLCLSQLLLLLHLLGEGLLLEEMGRLALQFLHARLVFLVEDALLLGEGILTSACASRSLAATQSLPCCPMWACCCVSWTRSAFNWRRRSSSCSSAVLGGVMLWNTVGVAR